MTVIMWRLVTSSHHDRFRSSASVRGRSWTARPELQRSLTYFGTEMGATSNHSRWVAGSSNVVECRDVLRCVLLVPNMLINLSSCVSSALFNFTGTIQVKHGYCIYCGTAFWTYHATTNRHMMHAFLFIKASPDSTRLLGVLADNCTSRFGRRRPYMLLGSVICAFSMLLLGFTRPVASIFTESGSHSVGLICSINNVLAYICLE